MDKDGCCQSGRWLIWLNVPSGSSVLVGRLSFRLTAILIPRCCGPLGIGTGGVGSFSCAPEWGYHSCVLPGSVLDPFLRKKCPFCTLSECFRKLSATKASLCTQASRQPFLLPSSFSHLMKHLTLWGFLWLEKKNKDFYFLKNIFIWVRNL